MSKYSDKKKRQAEEAAKSQYEKDDEKRIAKYNRKREKARDERRRSVKRIMELTNPEIFEVAKDAEKNLDKSGFPKHAALIGELRRRLVIAIGFSGEMENLYVEMTKEVGK